MGNQTNGPIRLSYSEFDALRVGDRILYKIAADTNFTPAEVTSHPGTTGVYIRLLDDYKGKRTQYTFGDKIIAGENEIYIDRERPNRLSLQDILQSGIYVRVGSETRDLVYGTTDKFFFEWLTERGFPARNETPEIPLSTKERYEALKAFESAGGLVAKILPEWSEFEERMKRLK